VTGGTCSAASSSRTATIRDLLGAALFAESDTDVCVYHGVPLYGIYRDGGSALWVGKAMRERWPDRVALYGPVQSPGSRMRWTSSSR